MNTFTRNIGFYLIVVILSILLAQYFIQPEVPTEELTYSNFIQLVEQNEIHSVTIVGENRVEGEYQGRQFDVSIPSGVMGNLMTRLETHEVEIRTEPEEDPAWWLGFFSRHYYFISS